MSEPLIDRHVVVTGGAGALGKAVVARLLQAGAVCHVPVRGSAGMPVAADGDRLRVVTGVELGDEVAVDRFYDRVPRLWASVHLAGGFAMAPLDGTGTAELEAMWRINLLSCVLCCREAVKAMRRSPRLDAAGEPAAPHARGWLVNVAARPALEPAPGMVAYAAAKAAVAAVTRSLAAELLEEGILVNAVLPSIMDTAANRAAMPSAEHERWPSPGQVAEAMMALGTPRNQITSGALVPVYGRA